MNMKRNILPVVLIVGCTLTLLCLFPDIASASVESSLQNIQNKLINTILPLLAIIGLAISGLSFASGNPSAKQHLTYAIIGCVVGFGAQSIVNLIQTLVK